MNIYEYLVLLIEIIAGVEAVAVDVIRVGVGLPLRHSGSLLELDHARGDAVLLADVRIVVPNVLERLNVIS